ncbi:hypothetical protein PR048_027291 [Dryococelus australis]|uniref:Uncharacterized protein n=1 Tax=Dryococelus australis TaxID=614101 RepID=A0ABQ9GGE6_9NEOP|nr:hypothetical protein PR048_027291 [Dryococelus australis]
MVARTLVVNVMAERRNRKIHHSATLSPRRPIAGLPDLPENRKILPVEAFSHFPLLLLTGAAVAERLDCSPPIQVNRARSPVGSLLDFRTWESCRTMPLVGGFSRGSPVSPRSFVPALLHALLEHPLRLSRPPSSSMTRQTARLWVPGVVVAMGCGTVLNNTLYSPFTRHDGNTARLTRRGDEALGERVSVARTAPSLLDPWTRRNADSTLEHTEIGATPGTAITEQIHPASLQSNAEVYNPFAGTSHFSETLLKFYIQDDPPLRSSINRFLICISVAVHTNSYLEAKNSRAFWGKFLTRKNLATSSSSPKQTESGPSLSFALDVPHPLVQSHHELLVRRHLVSNRPEITLNLALRRGSYSPEFSCACSTFVGIFARRRCCDTRLEPSGVKD